VTDGQKDWKEQVVKRLQPGKTTYCYVNRDDKSKAVIDREFANTGGVSPVHPVMLIPVLAFMVIGVFGVRAVAKVILVELKNKRARWSPLREQRFPLSGNRRE